MAPNRNSVENTVAFAFDIDGVLVHGKEPIAGARDTMIKLQKNNIPFIFLTNSGGVTEKANVEILASRLGNIIFDETQIVQSHTPFHGLVDQFRNKTILVLGGHGDKIRDLAHAYGFKNVVTSSDIVVQQEHVHPFPEMTKVHHDKHGREAATDKELRIGAILIWSSPRDWCLDLQLTLDLLMSVNGIVGTRSTKNGNSALPNNGYLQDGQPSLFFCNPDFEWATKYNLPRLAQGGFREALLGLWTHATKGTAKLDYTICGKPTETTYQYGERVLMDRIAGDPRYGKDIKTVYMIGDNPESDIAGANAYTSQHSLKWRSILVETGVYPAGTVPAHQPHHTAKDVTEAVNWALAQKSVRN
ncbi:hypothetical protein HJFPF1_02211 [Paramyrothecium foliicola]|nr:hypothetical protein HJFPF1_02211 [Paramyrothecium foliicola]